ncbi:hypothetical protein [Paenibacillus larvae]|uniref:Primosome component-like protein n=2 Tax=Paenibacillus larvae TaxID=1464 RepID=A0AAP5JRR7_9BACL|nr:hypothetical protein [Paenibacillus larvae]PCK72127.1 hypothetical protein PL1_2522 [Paenibacillus larvae subsp. larvae B-3650]ETK29797.1 hypothetical protein ERIC1_1c33560 [Paenibacillus larvae subsp. larvae DSM 25719]MDT2250803.1 hypothetical protein [Paenibacillus larvae]MDT2280548.1 hypothetical protein [Paenibacillus larvae]MDT2285737.1 hypothetical protein [Paenibacillus larvae]
MQGYGYIKDYRQELRSDIWLMPPLYHRVWQWLKYQANHQDNDIPMNDGSRLKIKRGQCLTSIRNIANGVGYYERAVWKEPNPKTISTVLDWLEKNEMITIERGNRQYTLITVINWEIYQETEDRSNSKVTPPTKKKNKKYPEDSTYFKMAQYFYNRVSAVAEAEGLQHLVLKADMQKWADEFRKIVELDKVDKKLAKEVMDWVTTDPFWKTNILSAKKLREKFADLAIKMRASEKGRQPVQISKDRQLEIAKEEAFREWVADGNDPAAFTFKPH